MDFTAIGSLDTNSYTHRPLASMHEFYLLGEVKSPDNYTSWFDIIRNCSPNDIIKLHINSPGGDLFTAIQFLRVLNECPGQVITSVEGSCMSAATMIFLCADQFEVSPHSIFMFHNYSTIMAGRGGELYKAIIHERKWAEDLMYDQYEGVLTDAEIESIINDGTIYMDGQEVQERLQAKIDAMVAEQEAAAEENGEKEAAETITISVSDGLTENNSDEQSS